MLAAVKQGKVHKYKMLVMDDNNTYAKTTLLHGRASRTFLPVLEKTATL